MNISQKSKVINDKGNNIKANKNPTKIKLLLFTWHQYANKTPRKMDQYTESFEIEIHYQNNN